MIIHCIILAVILSATAVPEGECILVNGSMGAGEWAESGSLYLDTDTEIRFQKNDENLFLAIVFHGPRHTGVDLYINSEQLTRMLHVSAALGEKVLVNNEWSEFDWGQNSWWTANQIGSIYEEGRQRFLEPDAFEFQMDRRELGTIVSLFVHLKRPEKMLPPGEAAESIEGWIQLNLE